MATVSARSHIAVPGSLTTTRDNEPTESTQAAARDSCRCRTGYLCCQSSARQKQPASPESRARTYLRHPVDEVPLKVLGEQRLLPEVLDVLLEPLLKQVLPDNALEVVQELVALLVRDLPRRKQEFGFLMESARVACMRASGDSHIALHRLRGGCRI